MSDDTNPAESGSALTLSEAVQLMSERRESRAGAPDTADGDANTNAAEDRGVEALASDPADPENTETLTPDEPASSTIDIDGVTLSADDIRRGYMRQSDYTRKTQDLANNARKLAADHQTKLDRVDKLIQSLDAEQAREPDWVQVARADPLGWVQKKALWDRRNATLNQAIQFMAGEEKAAIARNKAVMADELRANYNPAWRDAGTMTLDLAAMEHYALAEGYTRAELAQIDDPRHIRTLDKARKWDELQSQRPLTAKRVINKPNVQRPGVKSAVTNAHQRGLQSAWERFLKNPSVENGVAYQRARRDSNRAGRRADVA